MRFESGVKVEFEKAEMGFILRSKCITYLKCLIVDGRNMCIEQFLNSKRVMSVAVFNIVIRLLYDMSLFKISSLIKYCMLTDWNV